MRLEGVAEGEIACVLSIRACAASSGVEDKAYQIDIDGHADLDWHGGASRDVGEITVPVSHRLGVDDVQCAAFRKDIDLDVSSELCALLRSIKIIPGSKVLCCGLIGWVQGGCVEQT